MVLSEGPDRDIKSMNKSCEFFGRSKGSGGWCNEKQKFNEVFVVFLWGLGCSAWGVRRYIGHVGDWNPGRVWSGLSLVFMS